MAVPSSNGTIPRADPSRARGVPLVPVITPTYNHVRFIRECLDSVKRQTEAQWEQIVIDDGSDDGTGKILEEQPDPRVRVVRLPHRGIYHLADSYNTALGMARGDYVAVLEGDDFWPPDKLERQLPALADPAVVLSWGLVGITTTAGAMVRTAPSVGQIRRMQHRSPGEVLVELLRINFIPSSTVMCRRDALVAIGGFQQPSDLPTTDYPTWLAMCEVGPFQPVEHLLGYHRTHPEGVTTVLHDEMDRSLAWGASSVAALPDDTLQGLGIDRERVRSIERLNRADHDYARGRATERIGRHAAARVLFRQAIRNGRRPTQVRAVLSLAGSVLSIDLDRVSRALRRWHR